MKFNINVCDEDVEWLMKRNARMYLSTAITLAIGLEREFGEISEIFGHARTIAEVFFYKNINFFLKHNKENNILNLFFPLNITCILYGFQEQLFHFQNYLI